MKRVIERKNWFRHFTGYNEPEWDFNIETIKDKLQCRLGEFETISLNTLKNQIELTETEPQPFIPLHIYTRATWDNEEYFDTSSLQFNSKTNESIFLVASNFNCLEVSSTTDNPFDGKYLTFLMSDTTQGPSASSGAGLGAINLIAHHYKEPISLLEDVDLTDINGKLEEKQVSKQQVDKLEKTYSNIKVGHLKNTPAIFDRNRTFGTKVLIHKRPPLIHQVFTSTCIVRKQTKKGIRLQEKLLKVSYETIYLLAIKYNLKRIVLTFVGGGVFRNDMNTIIRIICQTHLKYYPYLSKDCSVILPCYIPSSLNNIKQYKKYLRDKLIKHTHFT